ncbi:MAG TPA: thioesterase family protein [Bacteroidales bacterium]|nr:thioesterase family protein [Bacteroidales bacterium]
MKKTDLVSVKEVTVRFNEVDSMGIVWHGSYAKYFEDGREDFGKKYHLGYLDIFNSGYYAPLVNLDFKFKKPLVYGDTALIKTTYFNTRAAKIIFEYEITSPGSDIVIATGSSVQVFLDKSYELVLYNPEFYLNWKKEHNLL